MSELRVWLVGVRGRLIALGAAGEDADRRAELRERLEVAGMVVLWAASIGFFIWLGDWLKDHWGIYSLLPQIGLVLSALCSLAVRDRRRWEEGRVRGLRRELNELDEAGHRDFEVTIRDLMRRDGFRAEQIGGAGDDACDVRAVDADGRIWAVQCKHRRDGWGGRATGVGVLQQVNGTAAQVHGARIAVVVTNGRFTRPAVEWAARQDIRLLDRSRLEQWASAGRPLWEVLGDVPRPRRLPGRGRAARPVRAVRRTARVRRFRDVRGLGWSSRLRARSGR
ncbi:restriction endonuclease [Streptomyces sp. NPDC058268]|uniref:restriction endonuclease n=1 Tax=Streptomyces sp. NPDC058268 TaxID=3346413 RepID=UPI0036EB6B5F